MKDTVAREGIELLLENDHRIANLLNDTRVTGVWRCCQTCERETWQKVINRTPAIYYCPICRTTWRPYMPDEALSEDEVKEVIGFKTGNKPDSNKPATL